MEVVSATARAINAHTRAPRGLPSLWVFTDPQRLPDPFAGGRRLPRGTAIVFRHFGAADRAAQARRLARLCRRHGLRFLIGADPILARRTRADGVHWPERLAPEAPRWKAAKPGWLVTVTHHGARGPTRGVDAIFLSPVFASDSPSASRPLGSRRARRLVMETRAPVIALGGVTRARVRRLRGLGFAGVAAVSAAAR